MSYFVDRIKPSSSNLETTGFPGEVAVVGSGITGLVEAYFLAKQGIKVTVYDAASRPGGKIRTSGNQYSGRKYEYGAEFVDSDDHTILQLCKELNIPKTNAYQSDAAAGDMLYHVGDKIYTEKEVLEWYAPVAPALQRLKDSLHDKQGNWTEAAVQLDHLSLEQFLQQLEENGVDKRLLSIFRQSYTSEVGNHSSNLSALNFIDCVNTNTSSFEPFGVSDEAFKLTNGTQSLTDALHDACEKMGVRFNYQQPVTNLERNGDKAIVHSELGGAQTYDHVVVATSLPSLKHIKGLENVGFPPEQIALLNSIQHVNAIKVALPTKGDAWKNCPIPSDGSFISDSSFQCAWSVSSTDTQLASPAAPAPHGMVMMLVGGVDKNTDINALIEQCKKDYARVIGKPVDEIFDNTVPPEFTVSRSDKNGCYVSPAPGQYVPLCTVCKLQPNGPASLVGSHMSVQTEIGNKLGFMECAASSAHANALAIAQKLNHKGRSSTHAGQVVSKPQDPALTPQFADAVRDIILGGGHSRT